MKEEIEINGKKYVLASSIKSSVKAPTKKGLTYCIVRTYSAGVFAGYCDKATKGKEMIILNARRIWYWTGANSLSQLAIDGTKTPDTCKFTAPVSEVILKEVIELIPCTKKAMDNILEVAIWQK